jgi:hypothetical protein
MKDAKFSKDGVSRAAMIGAVVRAMELGAPVKLLLEGGHVIEGKLLGYGGVKAAGPVIEDGRNVMKPESWEGAVLEVYQFQDFGLEAKWSDVYYVHVSQVVSICGRHDGRVKK